jgi:CheY-like chemotaxis protein/HPt (histidine-containing phosphotransfer) domain-containing protein
MNPRILLVEDDAVSRAFLSAAAEALPATVDAVETCAEALECARGARYDLWLIDANLPDGSGAGLLATLRDRADTPALAHTASHDRADHDALIAAGFVEVLVKPLPTITLQATIARLLGRDCALVEPERDRSATFPRWDDAAALAALKGEQAHVVALRRLFLDELAGQRGLIESAFAAADTGRVARTLHMLRASCGFVGAARLGEAVRALESDLQSSSAQQRFHEAASELLETQI